MINMPAILKFLGYRINTLSLLLKLPGYKITNNSGLLLKPPGYLIHRPNQFFTLRIQAHHNDINVARFSGIMRE